MINYIYPKGTKIVLLGTGPRAQKAYYLYRECYEVLGFIENTEDGGMLLSKPIFKFSELNTLVKQGIIIVICDERYIGLQKWFKKKNYIFLQQYMLDDFFMYERINMELLMNLQLSESEISGYLSHAKKERKALLIFGNCQTIVIKKYLVANERFNKSYVLLWTPEIHTTRNPAIFDRKELWAHVDVLAIIPINDDNRIHAKLSTNAFLQRCSSHTRIVIFPNLWFTGYFPQMERENECNVLEDVFPNGFAKYGDKILREYIMKGVKSEDSQKVIEANHFSEERIEKCFEHSFNVLKEIDQKADFGIGDYIKSNYRTDILFYSPNHPKNYVLKEVCSRLLIYLGLYGANDSISYVNEKILDSMEDLKMASCVVYPEVLKKLGLEDRIDTLTYIPGGIFKEPITFEEYVKYFIIFSQRR